MNKATVKNILVALVVLAIATMTACNLATPADSGSTVEVVLGGDEGARSSPGTITNDAGVAWVRINVKLKATGVTTGSGDLTKDIHNVWHGKITVSDVNGLMTFTATAGNQDGSTGVYHVSWAGSAEKNVTGSGLLLAITVSAVSKTINPRHIFYVNSNSATDGWRYLEVTPIDQSSGTQWYNGDYMTIGASAPGIGSGNANTTSIVTAQGAGTYAASLCANLVLGGYDDWFLPSKDELNALYGKMVTITGLAPTWYWSSSETDYLDAWAQRFFNGV